MHCLASGVRPPSSARLPVLSSTLLFLFSIVCQSASPLFPPLSAPQHKSVPGHSRHSTDAPNNDPLWKLPPICYLNGETASEVREVTGARPRPREPEALHKHCIAVGSIEISGIQHHCPTLLQVELSALTYFATAYFAQLLFCGGSSTRESRGTDVNEVLPKRFHSLA